LPYAIKPAGKNLFKVVNTQTGKVHAKATSLTKAKAQMRLLYSKERKK
jgi:hypothetical protein